MPPASRRGAPRRRAQTAKQGREAPQAVDVEEVTITVEDLSTSKQPLNILLAGPSGHGKTVLASFVPRCTILSTETAGTISAKRAGSRAKVIQTPQWEHVVAAKKWADAHLGADDWLVMDSLTKMQILMVRWILRMNHMENTARDLDIPAIQDHQKWQNYFKRFVDGLIDAKYNVIFICGDMIKEDEEGEEIVLPHIEGKNFTICNYVRAQTSVNIYFAVTDKLREEEEPEDGKPVRRALFQPAGRYVFPKDRTMSMGMYRNVYDGQFSVLGDWVAEMATAIEAGQADRAAAPATPIRPTRRKVAAR